MLDIWGYNSGKRATYCISPCRYVTVCKRRHLLSPLSRYFAFRSQNIDVMYIKIIKLWHTFILAVSHINLSKRILNCGNGNGSVHTRSNNGYEHCHVDGKVFEVKFIKQFILA